jgi:hypothetical protein
LELELVFALAGVVVVEDEFVGAVAVVDDGVVQVLEGGLEQSPYGLFLYGDDLVDLPLDVHRLAELQLELVLEVVHVLSHFVCERLGRAVYHIAAPAHQRSVLVHRLRVQGTFLHAQIIRQVVSI